MSGFPTPHLEKLTATHENDKLPACDKPRIERAIVRYTEWTKALDAVRGRTPDERLNKLVALLNDYRLWVDVELIFDSEDNFLYRQKGQLKLDNSIIEEFLPRLIHPSVLPEIRRFDVAVGPAKCFSALYFESSLDVPQPGGGMTIRTKAQDFAISKKLYLKASHGADFKETCTKETYIAYVVSECKTNLDKTMFQEASATAHDVKSAVSGARYYLLCEWLDMTPVSTAATDVDEVIILRKAKRLGSNVRSNFGSVRGRKANRDKYVKYLTDNPLRVEMFQRFLGHVRGLLQSEAPVESDVLSKGFF
ncbi:MAG TPA: Bpu10I family restriction endonuclease [Gemmataceae bacterium]|nr:Bpu10I family restriction endonuclease [Gemmataceae bacterium]